MDIGLFVGWFNVCSDVQYSFCLEVYALVYDNINKGDFYQACVTGEFW